MDAGTGCQPLPASMKGGVLRHDWCFCFGSPHVDGGNSANCHAGPGTRAAARKRTAAAALCIPLRVLRPGPWAFDFQHHIASGIRAGLTPPLLKAASSPWLRRLRHTITSGRADMESTPTVGCLRSLGWGNTISRLSRTRRPTGVRLTVVHPLLRHCNFRLKPKNYSTFLSPKPLH